MLKVEYKRDRIFQSKKEIMDNVLLGNRKVLIFGITNYAKIILDFLNKKDVRVAGIIDDFTLNKSIFGLDILKTNQVDKNSIIISGVVEGRPKTILNMLKSSGFQDILDYFDFNFVYPDKFPIPFNENNYNQILDNIYQLEIIYTKLEDDFSKRLFQEIIDFRLNFNYWEQNFEFLVSHEYFEPFFDFNSVSTFVDGGGFDGETTISAFSRFNNLSKVFFIEPYPDSMKLAKQKLLNHNKQRIIFLETAISNRKEIKKITIDKGNANHISNEGRLEVKASRLEELINEKIDYLKLDIEGEELLALQGAENLIKKYKPCIACCVYHNQNHFWQIPNYLLKLIPEYKIYLRHYTEGICETVMYFI